MKLAKEFKGSKPGARKVTEVMSLCANLYMAIILVAALLRVPMGCYVHVLCLSSPEYGKGIHLERACVGLIAGTCCALRTLVRNGTLIFSALLLTRITNPSINLRRRKSRGRSALR